MEKEMLVQLINKAKSGDQQAFEELLKEVHTPVSYQCRKMLDNEQDVEDATQEILLTIYTKLDTLEEPAAFYGWLGRITANQCKNALRKHKDLQFAEDEDGNSVLDDLEDLDERQIPDKALDNAETARMIDEIVSELPEAQRMTTLLFYYNEMSIKQIAEAMDIKEDAVKARLFNARKTIKAKVEGYEKQGIKLYSVSVLPLLWYFLRKSAQAQASGEAAAACAASVMGAGATAAVVGGSVAAGGTAAAAAATTAGTAIIGKIAAAIVAIAITICGIGIAVTKLDDTPNATKPSYEQTQGSTMASTTPSSTPTTPALNPLLDEAYAAYVTILKTASSPESDLNIWYYAYLDVDRNGIPELIVADGAGTPETWTIFEVYTYDENGLRLCGDSNSRYTYLTYVNDKYVLGTHRMGAQYIGVNDHITTTVYLWNEEGTRNDPAISINSADWQYITQEEFDYYNDFDAEKVTPGGFVQKIEIIHLLENNFRWSEPETEHDHEFDENGDCILCDKSATWGLEYELNADGDSYSVIGRGTNLSAEFIIPDTYLEKPVTAIGEWAFSGCDHLNSIYIPQSVESIQQGAFSGCENLLSIQVATKNPAYTSLDGVLFSKDKTQLLLYPSAKPEWEYIIPDTVTTIGAFYDSEDGNYYHSAFEGSRNLQSIFIGENVMAIGDFAFSECEALQQIEIPSSVTRVGRGIFLNCTRLVAATVNSGMIGYRMFQNCTELKSVNWRSVSTASASAFMNCESLEQITIPLALTSIPAEMFSGCIGLKSIELPVSVTSAGDRAFADCASLESLTIQCVDIKLQENAFAGCTGLQKIHYSGTAKQWAEITREIIWKCDTSVCVIYCSDGSWKLAEIQDESVSDF